MEIFEQVPKVEAVILPAAGQYGLLASTAAAIKHLNPQTIVIVSINKNSIITTLCSYFCINALPLINVSPFWFTFHFFKGLPE